MELKYPETAYALLRRYESHVRGFQRIWDRHPCDAVELESASQRHLKFEKQTTLLLGLAGAGAVGKEVFRQAFLERTPRARPLVKTATRAPRANEADGVSYEFIPERAFAELESNGEFLLARSITGRGRYGIRKARLLEALDAAPVCLVEESPGHLFELARAAAAHGASFDFRLLYLLAPPPVGVNLALRFFTRFLGAAHADRSAGLQRELESTLNERQVLEFAAALELFRGGRAVAFLVNDDPDRIAGRVSECLRAAGLG